VWPCSIRQLHGHEFQQLPRRILQDFTRHLPPIYVIFFTFSYGVPETPGIQIVPIVDHSRDTLRSLGADQAEAIVTLLSDEENYRICELAYEH